MPVAQNSDDDNGGVDSGDTDNGSDMRHCITHRHSKLCKYVGEFALCK